jgi:adenylate kinase family enzyme
MEGVKKVLQGMVTDMDITDLEQETLVVEEIFRCLKIKKTKAPKRPKRIILLGPPGSQKERYAQWLADKYKLVNVRVSQLITDHIRREENREYVEELRLRNRMQSQQMLPDNYILERVDERLSKPDCRINGWILDGCPFTLEQIKYFKNAKINPQLVIALEIQDEELQAKLEQYHFDPYTQLMYFTEDEVADADAEVQKRLEVREETREAIEEKLNQYRDFLSSAEEEFQRQLVRINGEDIDERVFLNFCSAIEGSI